VLKRLRYMFLGPLGVMYVEEEASSTGWRQAFRRLFSGGVKRGTPTPHDMLTCSRARRPLKRYKCKTCGTYFWSWRKRTACNKWECNKEE